MKKKKINLKNLKVTSFVTELNNGRQIRLKGGTSICLPDSKGCNSIGLCPKPDDPEPFSEGCTGWDCTDAGCTPAGSDVCFP